MATVQLVDNGSSIVASSGGYVRAVAWGHAADGSGEWFVRRAGEVDATRVTDRAAALAALHDLTAPTESEATS